MPVPFCWIYASSAPPFLSALPAGQEGALWYYDQLQSIINPRTPIALGAELDQ